MYTQKTRGRVFPYPCIRQTAAPDEFYYSNIKASTFPYTQAKDGEGSDTSSNRSRTMSQASNVLSDEASAVEAEGFLCPTCFAAFASPDDLQTHYQTDHLGDYYSAILYQLK